MEVFNWLMAHGKKTLSGYEWAKLLNVLVIDRDGWNDLPFDKPITLPDFIERVSRSTIR